MVQNWWTPMTLVESRCTVVLLHQQSMKFVVLSCCLFERWWKSLHYHSKSCQIDWNRCTVVFFFGNHGKWLCCRPQSIKIDEKCSWKMSNLLNWNFDRFLMDFWSFLALKCAPKLTIVAQNRTKVNSGTPFGYFQGCKRGSGELSEAFWCYLGTILTKITSNLDQFQSFRTLSFLSIQPTEPLTIQMGTAECAERLNPPHPLRMAGVWDFSVLQAVLVVF